MRLEHTRRHIFQKHWLEILYFGKKTPTRCPVHRQLSLLMFKYLEFHQLILQDNGCLKWGRGLAWPPPLYIWILYAIEPHEVSTLGKCFVWGIIIWKRKCKSTTVYVLFFSRRIKQTSYFDVLCFLQSWHQFPQFLWTTPAPRNLPRCTGRPCSELNPTRPLRWAITAQSWCAPAGAPAARSPDCNVARATRCMWHPFQRAASTCWTRPGPPFRLVRYVCHFNRYPISRVHFDKFYSVEIMWPSHDHPGPLL